MSLVSTSGTSTIYRELRRMASITRMTPVTGRALAAPTDAAHLLMYIGREVTAPWFSGFDDGQNGKICVTRVGCMVSI